MVSVCQVLVVLAAVSSCVYSRSLLNMLNEIIDDKPIPDHCGRSKYQNSHQKLYDSPVVRRSASAFGGRYHRDVLPVLGQPVKRIVGGMSSKYGEWPWLVTMRLSKNGSEHEHLCGGTLIHNQWILTAAHCFESVWADFLTDDPKAWMMRIGEHNMFKDQGTHVDVEPVKIIFHPDRNPPKTFNLDIALVKLAKPVKLNNMVNIACLPSKDDFSPPGTVCVTAGWGHTVEAGNVSTIVRHVKVPIIHNDVCNELYSAISDKVSLHISQDMLCAGYKEGGRDACQYDSGGPMVCYDDGQWVLTGVVSTGYGCARPGFPGIYTRVASFHDWIEDTVKQNMPPFA